MPELTFEIWADETGHSMWLVHPQNDKARPSVEPRAVLMHSFTATSSFEAFRLNNAWHGYAPWEPSEGVHDHLFTEEEAEEQRDYMSRRVF
ncbi:MAG TPA: hypothetical protein VGL58_02430 [Caulobacteraceae bacterium]|jgi:hypothetical protein